MAERIEAVGGSLTAGPAPDGTGWRIVLRVPVVAAAGRDAGAATAGTVTGGVVAAGGDGKMGA